MDFQTEYDKLTKTIDDTLSTQVPSSKSWINIPGTLIKAVSSSSGYVWGFDGYSKVYMCEMPCTGDWKEVNYGNPDDPSQNKNNYIQDIAVDSENVYVLLKIGTVNGPSIIMKNVVSNKGKWNYMIVPIGSTRLFSTSNYLWVQDEQYNKSKCHKPCTTVGWINNPDKSVILTSSSYTELYGRDGIGNPYKTDENMTTGWAPIRGLFDKQLDSVIGQGGQTDIYAIDTKSHVYSCGESCAFSDDVKPVDTGGYSPLTITSDGDTKSIWMTTSTFSDKGNIFTKLDKPDYSSILNVVDPLDKKRDEIVKNVENEYANHIKTETTNNQVQTVVDFFSKKFGYTKSVGDQNNAESSTLSKQIQESQQDIDKMSGITDKLLMIIIGLVGIAGLYLIGEPILGTYVHMVAAVVMTIGIFFIINKNG